MGVLAAIRAFSAGNGGWGSRRYKRAASDPVFMDDSNGSWDTDILRLPEGD